MSLKAVGDKILVRPKKEEEKTKSGIVLPDTVDKEQKTEGEILSVGAGEDIQKLDLKEGDVVLFGQYDGTDVEFNDEKLKILKIDEILAVVK